jgi:uncharacterized protein YbjT (DUF2867 family)
MRILVTGGSGKAGRWVVPAPEGDEPAHRRAGHVGS